MATVSIPPRPQRYVRKRFTVSEFYPRGVNASRLPRTTPSCAVCSFDDLASLAWRNPQGARYLPRYWDKLALARLCSLATRMGDGDSRLFRYMPLLLPM